MSERVASHLGCSAASEHKKKGSAKKGGLCAHPQLCMRRLQRRARALQLQGEDVKLCLCLKMLHLELDKAPFAFGCVACHECDSRKEMK